MHFKTDGDFNVGAVRFSLCLAEAELAQVHRFGMGRAGVLIVVEHGSSEVERRFVPLEQAMLQHIGFSYRGSSIVHALLIVSHDPDEGFKDLRKWFGSKDHVGRYRQRLIGPMGLEQLSPSSFKVIAYSEEVVTPPEEYFASEPSEFWFGFARFVLDWPIVDSCDFKWRVFLAILPNLVWMPISFAVRFLSAILLGPLLGFRDINWRAVFNLFDTRIEHVWFSLKRYRNHMKWEDGILSTDRTYSLSNFWFEDESGMERPPLWFIFWHPVVLIILATLTWSQSFTAVQALTMFVEAMGGLIVIVALLPLLLEGLIVVLPVLAILFGWAVSNLQNATKSLSGKSKGVDSLLVCEEDELFTSKRLLTRQWNIIDLLMAKKAKECRRYARG